MRVLAPKCFCCAHKNLNHDNEISRWDSKPFANVLMFDDNEMRGGIVKVKYVGRKKK
jgi:hypothetical protein